MNKSIYRQIALVAIIIIFGGFSASGQNVKVITNSSCRLFADIDNVSAVMSYIPKGAEVEVIDRTGEYLLVKYEEAEGFIRASKTNIGPENSAIQSNEDQAYTGSEEYFNSQTDRFSILVDKYGYRQGKAIFEHKIWKGIDNNMVKDSWGKPLNVNREINANETVELWIYRKSWLLFRNGILTEWGPNR